MEYFFQSLALLPGRGVNASELFGAEIEGRWDRGLSSHIQPLTCSDRSAPGLTVLVTEELRCVASGGPSDGKAATLQHLGGPKFQVTLMLCCMVLAAVGCA